MEEKREKIKRQIRYHLNEHQQLDKNNSRDEERIKRAEKAIDTLNQASEKIDNFLKDSKPRIGEGKQKKEVKSNITDNESAKMTTSKGTIQGYNGVATVDKKHQVIIDAQAFGAGQEHHTLKPVIEKIKERYQRLKISENIYATNVVVTADTGFANETNMAYLHKNKIIGYIPDNKFRSRDPKFSDQKEKYGKRNRLTKKTKSADLFEMKDFKLDIINKTCICPAGKSLSLMTKNVKKGENRLFFKAKVLTCRGCELRHKCMKNPDACEQGYGIGRQVSITLKDETKPTFTDWMKVRVDSKDGKLIYSHRMSVVEPVFGNIGTNKGLNRFSLRGKNKVNGQWKLFCLIHNIEKLKNYGELAA